MERFLQILIVFVAALGLSDALCNAFFPCPLGFQCFHFKCIPVQVCPPCSVPDPLGRCLSACGPHEACYSGVCGCLPGLCRSGAQCKPCVTAECNKDKHCSKNERCVDNKCICRDCSSRDKHGVCRSKCSSGEKCSRGKCVCDTGFCRVNNFCIPCQCRDDTGCPKGETCRKYKCECRECESRDKSGTCRALCGRNEVCNSGKCQCRSGYCMIDNNCKRCECRKDRDCPQSETCVNYKCRCAACESRDSAGKCQSLCGSNEECVNGNCACKKDYCKQNGVCKRCGCQSDALCGTNEVCKDYSCQCRNCYKRSSYGTCINACGKNEVCYGESCRCRQGYCARDGACRLCKRTSSKPRVVTKVTRRKSKSRAGCKTNAQCPYDEVCKNRRCVCQQCQRRNSAGRCESTCQENEQCRNRRCECKPHYCKRRGKCMYC